MQNDQETPSGAIPTSERLQIAYDGVQRVLSQKKAEERAFLIARADSFLEHGKQYDQDEWVGPNVARTLYRIIGELRDALEAAPL